MDKFTTEIFGHKYALANTGLPTGKQFNHTSQHRHMGQFF